MDSTLTLVFIGVVAFFVSQCFVSIYAEAADALIVCFLVDKENGPVTDSCPWELVEYLQEIKENNDVIEWVKHKDLEKAESHACFYISYIFPNCSITNSLSNEDINLLTIRNKILHKITPRRLTINFHLFIDITFF